MNDVDQPYSSPSISISISEPTLYLKLWEMFKQCDTVGLDPFDIIEQLKRDLFRDIENKLEQEKA